MSWRILIISNRAKLDLHLNHLVIRSNDTKRVYLGDIGILIIETTGVSITAALINELLKNKIKVIFCDEKRNPNSELMPYYGSHDTSSKIRMQIGWSDHTKKIVWSEIVREKINQQSKVLKYYDLKEYKTLETYRKEVQIGDCTNREGHSAKVYFNALFGKSFSRSADIATNSALNYGYAILLSTFNREINANGYITQIGIFHDNIFNPFNLTSDLMEIFRPIVDLEISNFTFETFDTPEKHRVVNFLNKKVKIANKEYYLLNAIKIYVRSVFDALNESDITKLIFFDYEL